MVTADPCASAIGSTYTSPVNHASGPFIVDGLSMTCIWFPLSGDLAAEDPLGDGHCGRALGLDGLSAVDDERVADRECRLVGAEPEDGGCDLLGHAHATDGFLGGPPGVPLRCRR